MSYIWLPLAFIAIIIIMSIVSRGVNDEYAPNWIKIFTGIFFFAIAIWGLASLASLGHFLVTHK